MSNAAAPAWFVTGTDTGVGKTMVSAALLQAWRNQGLAAAGMKPVAAGVAPGESENEDAEMLRRLSAGLPGPRLVNPVLLREPAAPSTAARLEQRSFELQAIRRAHDNLAARADVLIVEGAGGWRVPLAPGLDIAGLAAMLGHPVLLVVGLRLGCINHAVLSAQAICADGLRLAGWVGSVIDPHYRHLRETIAEITAATGLAPLACLPWLAEPDPLHAAWYVKNMSAKLLYK